MCQHFVYWSCLILLILNDYLMITDSNTSHPNTSHTYPKAHRLLTAKQFKRVFDMVQFKAHTTHLLAFVVCNDQEQARLGLAITKKKVPTAVARNRLKRRIRENFRLYHNLPAVDMVVIVKQSPNHVADVQLTAEIQLLLQKISKRSCLNVR